MVLRPLGLGLYALLGAKLHPRNEIAMQYLAIARLLTDADLVIIGEGSIDFQTPLSKILTGVAQRAKKY